MSERPMFRGEADYKAAFAAAVDELIAQAIADRIERMAAIQVLIDEYVAAVGERPDGRELYRLANEILREELTDRHPDKVVREEYPIMSDGQLERRDEKTVFVPDMYTGKNDVVIGRQKVAVEVDDDNYIVKKRKIYDYMAKKYR